MAILKSFSRLIPFVAVKDPKTPALIWWAMASPSEWNEHKARSVEIALDPRGVSLAPRPEAVKQQVENNLAFAIGRIKKVTDLAVENEDGSVDELAWPADADRILLELNKHTGIIELFVKTVLGAHNPDKIDDIPAAIGGGVPKN